MHISLVAAMTALMILTVPLAAVARTDEPNRGSIAEVDVKGRALAAIDRRMDTITRLRGRITSHPHVSGEHQSALLGEIGRVEAGLNSLAAEIRGTESMEELRVLVPKIADDFRIHLVVVPKVNQVLGSDSLVSAGDRLGEAAGVLESWIDRAADAGYDVTEAEAHLAEMRRHIAASVSLGEPVAAAVLPLTAADWPDPARRTLADGRADLIDARHILRSALASGHEAVKASPGPLRGAARAAEHATLPTQAGSANSVKGSASAVWSRTSRMAPVSSCFSASTSPT